MGVFHKECFGFLYIVHSCHYISKTMKYFKRWRKQLVLTFVWKVYLNRIWFSVDIIMCKIILTSSIYFSAKPLILNLTWSGVQCSISCLKHKLSYIIMMNKYLSGINKTKQTFGTSKFYIGYIQILEIHQMYHNQITIETSNIR